MAWSVTGASAWQVLDADHNLFILTLDGSTIHVSRPLITAQVVSASIAAAGGVGGGVAASIGASRVRNLIGWTEDGTKAPAEIRSYVSNSSIKATGVLSQSALNSATIDARAFAGSVAASGGGSGTSLGGAGASIANKIATRVEATIDGDGATGITVGSVSLRATDASMISSSAGAAAVSASFGAVGVAVSIKDENNLSIGARVASGSTGAPADKVQSWYDATAYDAAALRHTMLYEIMAAATPWSIPGSTRVCGWSR